MNRTTAITAVALVLAFAAGGCAARQCCGTRERSMTADEIDAAGHLSFDPSRVKALERIASRQTVSPAEQAHRVCVTMNSVDFDPNREEVLTARVENPAFSPPAKACILRHFDRFTFDTARVDLLRAMEGRGDSAPPADQIRPAPPE